MGGLFSRGILERSVWLQIRGGVWQTSEHPGVEHQLQVQPRTPTSKGHQEEKQQLERQKVRKGPGLNNFQTMN